MKTSNKNMFKIGVLSFLLGGAFLMAKCSGGDEQINSMEEVVSFSAEQEKELRDQANIYFASISSLPVNTISEEKIGLGKKLYYDNRLSMNNTISCNSCHNLNTSYGVDNLPLSPGDTKELGGRNSPTNIYASLHAMQFWDGRAKDVEEQAGGPLLNPVEHALPSAEYLEEKLQAIAEYQEFFAQVYPDASQPITFANITDAIGAFERQLNPMSRFDEWLDGDDSAMSTAEKEGLIAFIDNSCITCHSGIGFGGTMLQKFGLNGNYWEHTGSENIDKGRFDETNEERDMYFFKVPGLRNIEKTFPYFHDGSVANLEEAVKIMGDLQTDRDITEEDVKSITTFLKALTADVGDKYKE